MPSTQGRISPQAFCVRVPCRIAEAVLSGSSVGRGANHDFALQVSSPVAGDCSNDMSVSVPYPHGVVTLLRVLCHAEDGLGVPEKEVKFFVARSEFERAADAQGFSRPRTFEVTVGMACGDEVAANLLVCLERVLTLPDSINRLVVDGLAEAVLTHLARRYGGAKTPTPADAGGLAPWQLRRTRALIEKRLTDQIPLSHLAVECGLSISHFARRFTQSTGIPPHRWMMARRVELATTKMAESDTPLADLALECGFSDQSHFTRVFSAATGKTPGRWRTERRNDHTAVLPRGGVDGHA